MKNNLYLVLVFALIASQFSQAQDCTVTTDTRRVLGSSSELVEDKINSVLGRYTATLKNGDSFIASFAQCDLGLRGHYFSTQQLSGELLTAKINWLLKNVLPNEEAYKYILPQLSQKVVKDFKNEVVFKGINDEHKILLRDSTSPLFQSEIYYEWLPPQY